MTQTIDRVMTRDPVTIEHRATVREAAKRMARADIGDVIVMKDGKVHGIVTDRDMMRALPSPLSPPTSEEYEVLLDETPIERIMTREPLTVEADTSVKEAVRLMLDKKIGGLPVLRDGAVCGLFTQTDALRGYLRFLEGSAPAAAG